jgi:O-antigen ligase/tetratricopeptide (TPR) repeat protein
MSQRSVPEPTVVRTPARWCLLVLVVVVPLVPIIPLAGATMATKQLLLLGVAGLGVLWLLIEALRGAEQPALGTPTDLALGAWLLAALASAAAAEVPGLAHYDLGLYVGLGCCYVLAIKTLRCKQDVGQLYAALLAGALVIAIMGLAGFLRFRADGAAEESRSMYLGAGLFPHSYLAAQYVVPICAGALVALTDSELARRTRRVLLLALLPLLGFLAVTGSRGAYLAVGVALTASGLVRALSRPDRGRRRTALTRLAARGGMLAGGLVVLAVLTSLTGLAEETVGHAVDRVMMLFDPQKSDFNYSRLDVWRGALAMVADHVFLGVGIGNFDSLLPTYMPADHTAPHAHNQFVHVAAEMGVTGLLAFLFLARHARHAAMKGAAFLLNDSERRVPFHAALAGLVAALAYFLWETPMLWVEAGSLVVILLAVMTRAGCVSRMQPANRLLGVAGIAAVVGLALVYVPASSSYLEATRLGGMATAKAEAAELTPAGVERDGLYQESLDLLDLADDSFPHGSDFLAVRAHMLSTFGRHEEALAVYQEADARVPNTYMFNSAIGSLLMRLTRPKDAIAPLRRAVIAHMGRKSAPTYARLAQAYLQTARLEEAWYCYSTLIEDFYYENLQPSVLFHAARTLQRLDRNLGIAREMLIKYAALDPEAAATEPVVDLRARINQMLARSKRVPQG